MAMATTVVTTSEVRAALGQITGRFDEGDTEPVFFGSHRRAQAVLVPIATWEKLLEHAEDALDIESLGACGPEVVAAARAALESESFPGCPPEPVALAGVGLEPDVDDIADLPFEGPG